MNCDLLTFLPPIGDSETLYSICSALHHLRGGSSWQGAGIYFFDNPRASWHRQIPRNVDHFCRVTRNLLGTPEEVLNDRTIVGFHARFMNHDDAKDFIAQARTPSEKVARFPSPDTKRLRLCVQCVMEDREELGRGTWRLEHHLPGARVCMVHGHDLQEVSPSNAHRFRTWLRPDDYVGSTPNVSPANFTPDRENWACLAQVLWVLKCHPRISPPLLHHVLAEKLASIRAIPAARFLNSKAAESWLNTKRHVVFLHSDLEPLQGKWLRFLDGRGAQHPLRWAVLFASCMGSWELNVALGRAYSLQATLDGRWEVSGQGHLDLLPQHVWDALLDGVCIRKIAQTWRMTAVTINRALRLNPELKSLREEKVRNDLLIPKRDWVSSFLRRKPNASRADLRKADSAKLRWLDLNDKEWLWRQVPPTKSGRWPQRLLFAENAMPTANRMPEYPTLFENNTFLT